MTMTRRRMASDMSAFDKDDYLRGVDDAESLKGDSASSSPVGSSPSQGSADQQCGNRSDSQTQAGDTQGADQSDTSRQEKPQKVDSGQGTSSDPKQDGQVGNDQDSSPEGKGSAEGANPSDQPAESDGLTPLGQAKKEAADYLEALQRERAEFVNFRNRTKKEQDIFRQHGIIDVLTALLPALDDIDRIKEHGQIDDSFKAVAAKIDKTFEKFGVEKFGKKGEDFDPTKHEAILHKPDPAAKKETVDTVVEAGYRIGDRVIRAARVVVTSPEQ